MCIWMNVHLTISTYQHTVCILYERYFSVTRLAASVSYRVKTLSAVALFISVPDILHSIGHHTCSWQHFPAVFFPVFWSCYVSFSLPSEQIYVGHCHLCLFPWQLTCFSFRNSFLPSNFAPSYVIHIFCRPFIHPFFHLLIYLFIYLFLLYTSDVLTFEKILLATFVDETAIMAIGNNNTESAEKLQAAITKVKSWTRKWRIKLNEIISVHIDSINKRIEHKPIYINHQVVPHENTARYLGMNLDTKFRWKPHVKKVKEKPGRNYSEIQKNVLVNVSLFCPICI